MNELVVYVLGGIVTGLAGGYLGVGGGTILIPYLTLIAGMDISRAVPISLAAVVMNSIAGSTDYLKKAMVDMELAVVLAIFLVMGNIAGSLIHSFLPMGFVQGLFAVMLVYTGFTMLRGRKEKSALEFGRARARGVLISIPLTFLVGALGGLIGLGGAEFLIPLFFLVIGVPLATARGTASFMVGFSAAAALAVYYFRDAVDIHAVAPVVVGIILGGKIGGLLGSRAKPMAVRVLFSGLLFYLAYRLGWKSWENFM